MTKQWLAEWLTDEAYLGLEKPLLFHKETAVKEAPAHDPKLRHHHWHARKTFEVEGEALEGGPIHLDITADDYYKAYVNGAFVGQGPAQSDAEEYYYNRLDIRDALRPGRNAIAVHVYYQGLLNRAYNSADYRQGLIAEIRAGDRLLVKSDETWKAIRGTDNRPGEAIGYDTQFTERVDARLSLGRWTAADYDDASWPNAAVHPNADYRFTLQPTPILSVYKKKPVQVARLAPGHYLIDFGEELTGQFTMKARGEAGEEVEILSGEELLPDGRSVRYELRCNCLYRDTWALSGGEDTFETFDYKGFRYVEARGPEKALQPDSFRAIVRHYPLDEGSCRFASSDERMNRIFAICKNGVKYGAQENYVDCPTREKGQYLGDNTVIGHSHMLISGDLRLYRKAIEQFARSSSVCEGLMAVVPGHLMQEIADYSLQWPMQLLEYYRYSGDLAFVERMYPYAERLLTYFESHEREDGLLRDVFDKWNLVDWPQELRDGYDFDLSRPVGPGCHNVVNAFYLGCIRATNEIRDALGIACEDRLPELQRSFVRAFYDESCGLFVDAEGSRHHALHANALPLLFDLAPEEAVPSIVGLMRKKRLACGVYFSYFVLRALARAGEHALIYDLMSSEDEHSWGNMLKEGATACFEAWGKDQKWNTSLCHPWASAPIPLLIEEIIGLRPAKPGWTEIAFSPRVPASWTHCKLELRVRSGAIRLEYRNGEWECDFPAGVRVVRE
ncbi:family 78 glycoside hydrolase catalytic domain [Cohnella cellulosilytica]|uniref:alpha-L-rhamnosidase n=1 Tax=Cohnella cellulosilytica TaxID=986710 RepID=A0ABW2F9U1_9BACL